MHTMKTNSFIKLVRKKFCRCQQIQNIQIFLGLGRHKHLIRNIRTLVYLRENISLEQNAGKQKQTKETKVCVFFPKTFILQACVAHLLLATLLIKMSQYITVTFHLFANVSVKTYEANNFMHVFLKFLTLLS